MIGEDTRPRHLLFFWSSNPQEEDTETDADPQRSFRQSILRIWLKKRMLTSEAFLGYESIGIRHRIWRSSSNVLAVSGHIKKFILSKKGNFLSWWYCWPIKFIKKINSWTLQKILPYRIDSIQKWQIVECWHPFLPSSTPRFLIYVPEE